MVDTFNILDTPSTGLILIERQIIETSTANVDFTSGITDRYRHYFLTFANVEPSAASIGLITRYSIDGGASFDAANNYSQAGRSVAPGGANTNFGGATVSGILMTPSLAINEVCAGNIYLWDLSVTGNSRQSQGNSVANAGTNCMMGWFGGVYRANTGSPINAIRLLLASANILQGEFNLYGITK